MKQKPLQHKGFSLIGASNRCTIGDMLDELDDLLDKVCGDAATYTDGDSIELCQQLRAANPLTPVLLFSLESTGHHNQRAADTGALLYVSRTSDFVSLVQTIDRLLQP